MRRLVCGCVPDDPSVPPTRCRELTKMLTARRGVAAKATQEPDVEVRADLWLAHHQWTLQIAAHLAPAVQEEVRAAA